MKWILAERQSGKTTELIRRFNLDKRIYNKYSLIVCPSKAMCRATFSYAKRIGLDIPMPITFDEFINGGFEGRHVERFYFDELQISLQSHARGVPIDTVVVGIGDYNLEKEREKNS